MVSAVAYAVELWIDNAGAVGSLIKGYSGVPDVARIINMFEFSLAKLGISSLYIDYVPTKSNPADVPSRPWLFFVLWNLISVLVLQGLVSAFFHR